MKRISYKFPLSIGLASASYVLLSEWKKSKIHENQRLLEFPCFSWKTKFYRFFRPMLFTFFEPENAHKMTIKLCSFFGKYLPELPWMDGILFRSSPPHSVLGQTLFNMKFSTPIGIAAGFDKNGETIDFFRRGIFTNSSVGHLEIGSVTNSPWSGNPKPRLFRFPGNFSILNRMGLNNEGSDMVGNRLEKIWSEFPFGVNIAKTPNPNLANDIESIKDILETFRKLGPKAKWITLNVSCPNTSEGKLIENSIDYFSETLSKIIEEKKRMNLEHLPILVKLSPLPSLSPDDSYTEHITRIVGRAEELGVSGFVIANTVPVSDIGQDMNMEISNFSEIHMKGGISGKPILKRTLCLVDLVYRKTNGEIPIVACGGIFSAEDAYEAIRHGASLIQIYSAMVYDGLGVFEDISRGLAKRLIRDGFKSIEDARGKVNVK